MSSRTLKEPSVRHFLDLDQLDPASLRRIVDNGHAMKKAGKRPPKHLMPKGIDRSVLVMIFEKPSTRTRVSFDIAMRQLGGQSLSLENSSLQLGRGESIADTARVLSRYADAIMLRANAHEALLEFARYATIPVINGLTDRSHPCQIVADMMTFEEHKGPIGGQKLAWIGDGNNVATSFIHAATLLGFELALACPAALKPDPAALDWARANGGQISVTTDPVTAVRGAACVVTDTWVSMGQSDAARRKKLLAPYAVTEELMAKALPGAIFMHCLPAYREHEVAGDVIDGPRSVIFDEAENRLHAQKSILAWCLGAS